MKYIILLTALLFLSCDVTEPEVEDVINCSQIYFTENGVYSSGYCMMGVYSITVAGVQQQAWQSDVIKVTTLDGKLKYYEIYRFGNYYFKEPKPEYKYYWKKK